MGGEGDLRKAQGMTLCKKTELQTWLMLIPTLWKLGELFGACLGIHLSSPCRAQRTSLSTESVILRNSVKIHRSRGGNRNQFGHFGREQCTCFMELC